MRGFGVILVVTIAIFGLINTTEGSLFGEVLSSVKTLWSKSENDKGL